jgi:hypothetical protein
MHIHLSPLNSEKMLVAAQKLNRSVGDLVNLIVECIDEVEIAEKLQITAKDKVDAPLSKPDRTIRKKAIWRTRL